MPIGKEVAPLESRRQRSKPVPRGAGPDSPAMAESPGGTIRPA